MSNETEPGLIPPPQLREQVIACVGLSAFQREHLLSLIARADFHFFVLIDGSVPKTFSRPDGRPRPLNAMWRDKRGELQLHRLGANRVLKTVNTGAAPLNHLSRRIKLDVCKDGTLSYRDIGEPRLNTKSKTSCRLGGGALPVFSVDEVEQALAFQAFFCRKQYDNHPEQPRRAWMKLSRIGDGSDPTESRPNGLELDDLEAITTMFQKHWDKYFNPGVGKK